MLPLNQIVQGDCLAVMREWPEESVDLVMFSPPYWGLRNYGESTETVWGGDENCNHKWVEERMTLVHENRNFSKGTQEEVHGEKSTTYIKKYDDQKANVCIKCGAWRGQLGLEPTWQMYISHMVTICQELKRVLKQTGNAYIVLGDTYAASRSYQVPQTKWQSVEPQIVTDPRKTPGYQPKCLMGIPWRVAFALIDDGWILRERIVWHKDNPMPGSQKDRLTQTCEVIFHFVRNTRKSLLWRNELTAEWVSEKPKQVYYHTETHELRDDHPPKEEKYKVDELGHRRLVWKPLWRGFDYYYELDAIREPHQTSSIKRAGPTGLVPFNLRLRGIKQRKKGAFVKAGKVKMLTASQEEVESYVYPENRDLEALKAYCLQEYEKETKKRVAYTHKGGSMAPESFHRLSGWTKGTRETMNAIINSLSVPKSVKSRLRTWWHDVHGHVKGKNPGDIFQTKKEPYIGNNPHRMRLHDEQFLALDPSRPMDLSHPKGKNPGDIILTKHDIAVRDCPTVNRQGGLGYTDPLHVKAYHEKGKNPGDVVRVQPKGHGHDRLGSRGPGLRPWEERFHPNGKNPGDVFYSLDGRGLGTNVGEKGKLVDKKNQWRPPTRLLRLDGKNPGDIVQSKFLNEEFIKSTSLQGEAKANKFTLEKAQGRYPRSTYPAGKNPGDFWSISTKPFSGAHFAVYPEAICVRPIVSSCPPGGVVLDPMCGSGTTCSVAKKLGRRFIGIEINPAYVEMARKRLETIPERLDTYIEK